jgi:cleavage and polyadenylation specificity factor subunit 1
VEDFMLPAACFINVHVNLVGSLPTLEGYTYCLYAIDRFTRRPKVFSIPDITANIMHCTLLNGLISRLGCPQTIINDQGRQFESQLCHSLTKLCESKLFLITVYHSAAKGLMKRFHRTLKAAIMCQADQRWTEVFS